MFLSTKSKSALILLSIFISCTLSAEPGFFATDPTRGQINWLSRNTGSYNTVFDTYLSFPTAIAVNQDLDIYFANTAPSALPWVSKTTVINNEGSQNQLVYLTTDTDTYSGSVIDSLATDETFLFYLVSNLPLTAEYADYPLIVSIDTSNSEVSNILSYSSSGFSYYPTSMALDYDSNHLYFTTMQSANESSEIYGTIYKLGYDGSDLENIWTGTFSSSSRPSISSLQYSNSSLFYIETMQASKQYDIKRFNLDDNSTVSVFGSTPVSFIPRQIYIPAGTTSLYVLDSSGNVYLCTDLSCQNFGAALYVLPENVDRFVVDEASQTVFYTGRGISAIQSTNAQGSATVSIGISIDSQIWADTVRSRVYYSTNNVINSINVQGSSWHWAWSLNDNIRLLSGDSISGNLVVSYQTYPGVFVISPSGSQHAIWNREITAMAVFHGTVYFASAQDNNAIFSCPISTSGNCVANPIVIPAARVYSLSIGENGAMLYYALENATFSARIADSSQVTLLFNTVNNIKPFAVASYESNIIFLDSPSTGGLFLRNCTYPSCSVPTLLASNTQVSAIGSRQTGWITVDSDSGVIYWSASTLYDGEDYLVGRTQLFPLETSYLPVGPNMVTGLSWGTNSSLLYVSLGTDILVFDPEDENNQTCSVSVSNLIRTATVGAIASTPVSLYWAELVSGSIYNCPDSCSELNCAAVLYESGTSNRFNCARSQFLAPYSEGGEVSIYSQYNCGGIAKTSSTGTTKLKNPDGFPITSLTVAQDSKLVYALPYRATISVASETSGELGVPSTYFSGTGYINNLYVDDAQADSPVVYWVNKEGASMMVYNNELFTNYNPLSVGAFSFVRTGIASVTITISRSVSVSPSVSVAPSVVPSVSASASASASISSAGSVDQTVSPSPSVSQSAATEEPSISVSGSPSVSVSSTTTVSATPSGTLSESTTPSTFSGPPSGTPTPTNTPYIAELGDREESPIIGRTGWEVIIFVSVVLLVCCVLPLSCYCWRRNTAAEMALSLRLPDGDEI